MVVVVGVVVVEVGLRFVGGGVPGLGEDVIVNLFVGVVVGDRGDRGDRGDDVCDRGER